MGPRSGFTKVADQWENWRSHSVSMRDSLEMPPDHEPWTSKANLTGVPKHPRHADSIQIAYFAWLKSLDSKVAVPRLPQLCVDISQGCERRPWGPDPHTVCKGSLVYSFALDRVLDAEDIVAACCCLCVVNLHR